MKNKNTHKDSLKWATSKKSDTISKNSSKYRNALSNKRSLNVMLLVVLVAILVVNGLYAANAIKNSPSVAPANGKILSSLQVGEIGSTRASVSKITENSTTDPAFTLDPSQTLLVLNIQITNLSDSTQKLIPNTQLYIRDNQGYYAAEHASIFVTNPLVPADLKPGQSASGQLSFAVPKITASPLLYVDTQWNNYGPLVFDVLH